MAQSQDVRDIPESKEVSVKPIRRVFVYGTLRKGFGNYHNLNVEKDGKFLGDGYISGIMFHLGGFPAISVAEPFQKIYGEVYEVNESLLSRMDYLEGHPSWYKRILVDVVPYGATWVYTFPREFAINEKRIVPGGRWEGTNTPSVSWLGFDSGIEVGKYAAFPMRDLIKVGEGDRFILKPNYNTGTYSLLQKKTGEFCGSYRNLGDILSTQEDYTTKPRIRLPAVTVNTPAVSGAVKEHLSSDGSVSTLPVPYSPPPRRTPEEIAKTTFPIKHHELCKCRDCYTPPTPAQIEEKLMEIVVGRAAAMGLKVKRA